MPREPVPYLDLIRAGLHGAAANRRRDSSDDVFGNFPEQVYGKTGTAQYNNQQDYSWYACFVPPSATTKPIVVVVWVEQGGFGAVAAAPAARADPLAVVLRQARTVRGRRLQDAMSATPIQATEDATAARPRTLVPIRPAASAGCPRPRGLFAANAQGGHEQRGVGRSAVLRQAPGDLRRDRNRGHVAALADRLLTAARVQVRSVRGDDRAQPGGVRDACRSAAAAAGSRFRFYSSSLRSSARCCWSLPWRDLSSIAPAVCRSAVRRRGSCCWP